MATKPKPPAYSKGNYGGATPTIGKPRKGKSYPGAKKPLLDVPYGSYDPAIDAQLRASQRGLDYLREDHRTAVRWAKQDLSQNLFDLGRKYGRGRQDLNRSTRRNRQDIGIRSNRESQKIAFRRADLNLDASRGREDLASRMAAVGRQFTQQASAQKEAMNASGTLAGGAAAAAAEKRAENQAIAEAPIKTAGVRLEQDLASSLNRLKISENQLGQDTGRALNRLGQDRSRSVTRLGQDARRDRKLTHQGFRRGQLDRRRKLQRGIVEQKIGEADLLAQKIDSARQRSPGAFSKYGSKRR